MDKAQMDEQLKLAATITRPVILNGAELSDIFASLMFSAVKISHDAPEDALRCRALAESLVQRFAGITANMTVN